MRQAVLTAPGTIVHQDAPEPTAYIHIAAQGARTMKVFIDL